MDDGKRVLRLPLVATSHGRQALKIVRMSKWCLYPGYLKLVEKYCGHAFAETPGVLCLRRGPFRFEDAHHQVVDGLPRRLCGFLVKGYGRAVFDTGVTQANGFFVLAFTICPFSASTNWQFLVVGAC